MNTATFDSLGPFDYVKRYSIDHIVDSSLLELLQLDSVKTALQQKMHDLKMIKRSSACNNRFFANDSVTILIQKAFFEHIEEGDNFAENPYYEGETFKVEFTRVFLNDGKKWMSFPWEYNCEPRGFAQPELIAFSVKGSQLSTIFYQSEGICCPSKSSLVITVSTLEQDSIVENLTQKFDAGLGQPCD